MVRLSHARLLGIVAALSVFMSAPCKAAGSITHLTYSVAATNDEWTPTQLEVSPGDILITKEGGDKITVGAFLGKAGANGLDSDKGALLMKIGTGAQKKIGTESYTTATDSGTVKLKIQDTKYSDNSGSYTVNVLHIPAALVPAPKPGAPGR